MKKIAILILPLFIVLISGCVSQSDKQAVDALQEAITKSQNYSTYTSTYTLDMSMDVSSAYGSQSFMSMSGVLDAWKRDDRIKMMGPMTVNMLGQQISTNMYIFYIPEGFYICTDDTATCEQNQDIGLPVDVSSTDQTVEMLQDMVEEGIVAVTSLGTKSVIGRTCDNIKFTVDPNKVFEIKNTPIEITPEIQQAMQNMVFYYTVCFDQESGLMLDYITYMSVQQVYQGQTVTSTLDMSMTVTALDFNADVNESIFELPYTIVQSI